MSDVDDITGPAHGTEPPPTPASGADAVPADGPEASVAVPEAPSDVPEVPARGFPGFPAGDPRQVPLAQRPRGLDAPPIPGGGDPALNETLRRERPYMRLLVAMIAIIVGGSLILTFLAIISAAILR